MFVPFLDATSGSETYGAGRYLDLEPDEDGTYAIDTRLRDRLRGIGFGAADASSAHAVESSLTDVAEAAQFAAEYSALGEADLGASFGARIDELEARLAGIERSPAARVRRLAGSRRS